MAAKGVMWSLLSVLLMAAVVAVSAATTHEVGGSAGWSIPANSTIYPNWAATQTFLVGDSLHFTFTTGAHDVLEVSKSNYDSCTNSNPINSQTTGPATLTLSTTGAHYYICGFPSHCSVGQKLSVNVLPSTTPSTTPSLAGVPTSAPPPSSGSGSGSGSGGSSSASSSTLPSFGLSVVFAAAAAAPLLF
ncbi:hypothetical protein QJS10_CPB14g01079 [Acorus calamus]|uniref:Phytocyanin domain-containing protein n=1 Tax=Acorus calamus TaxID=4465 RepID=A0AAV9DDK5_ACOCL|nr:hypothetical protein QJS10_CPB14g01079 [Acorus calamus]